MTIESQPIVIIGGGVIGSAIAYFLTLQQPGCEVVVVERDPNYARASSALSASSIRQQFSTDINIQISAYGIGFLRNVGTLLACNGDVPDIGLHEGGYLYLATRAGESTLRENHALQTQHGADVALLSPQQLAKRFPWLALQDVALGSLGLSGEGWFDGYLLLTALRKKAQSQGVRYVADEAVGLDTVASDGALHVNAVRLQSGTVLPCRYAVNAGGPWAAAIAGWAGIDLPVVGDQLLQRLDVPRTSYTSGTLAAHSPITGEVLAHVPQQSPTDATAAIGRAHAAFWAWRNVPAPRRGELVRLLGEELRAAKADLGLLVTIEAGKIPSEGLGEVQEMIDICDFAVGLSRQLYGLTIATERPGHRMMEIWHPLGVCGVISAFNFPVAVWSWNAALALVCGDSVVWKPSEKTPLTALATHVIAQRAIARFGSDAPEGLLELIVGQRDIGEVLVDDARVPVLSATGSTAMGRTVGPRLAARFARGILELGGNNAAIVAPTADLDLALRGIAFAAMGTAGQRCTTLRRLFVHESIYDQLVPQLAKVYANVQVGDPRTAGTLVGPLIDRPAFDGMQKALEQSRTLGATVHGGGRVEGIGGADAYYVRPALVELQKHEGPALHETFAPILYVTRYSTLDAAIAMNNAVGAGLSSSIFTLNVREAEQFMSAAGSDCGIANVNIGPSGAEIGGAFGGEKETGGGREAGSDSWKAYMRRATNTINYSTALPLAQGVTFDV